jgi:4-hydroxythreonine-4-phosphate dehydrogenase
MPGPIAVSLGDPAGIGPELIAEAWHRREAERLPAFFVVGSAQVLRAAAKTRGFDLPIAAVTDLKAPAAWFATALPVLEVGKAEWRPGRPDSTGTALAAEALERAVGTVGVGVAAALVTGPTAKAEMAKIGFDFPGQTEFLAAWCEVRPEQAVMMLAGPSLRTVPLTVHIALAQVPSALTRQLIVERARIVAQALITDFGIARPRLAVCGLNPHAGENGRMGREEIEIIAPAIAALRNEGIDATGPHPADTLFAPHRRAAYDVALAMYHDQALVPLKTLDFDHGVNVTLGLPIVRTSPDHGTAFDIAGQNIASPSAMIAAIRMSGEIALRRAAA